MIGKLLMGLAIDVPVKPHHKFQMPLFPQRLTYPYLPISNLPAESHLSFHVSTY